MIQLKEEGSGNDSTRRGNYSIKRGGRGLGMISIKRGGVWK